MRTTNLMRLTGGLLSAGLVLAACGGDDGDDAAAPDNGDALEAWPAPGDPDYGANCVTTEGSAAVPDPDGTGDDDSDLSIGVFDGWDESYASAYLLAAILEDMGYTVDTSTELEAGLAYAGVASGDIDFVTDGWLPVTHPDLLDEFGDSMESLGCWYDNAALTIAVNDDAPVDSLADLADYADEFGGQVFGIEPGAGLTRITEEEVFPTYGLEEAGFSFDISSTPAMIAQLKSATDAGENVVVTLWEPHWAYDAFPIKNLEDPEGTLGEIEFVFSFAREGFTEENSNAAQLVRNFVMTGEELAELENLMFSDEHYGGGDHAAAVADWLADNQDWVDRLKAGDL